MAFWTMLVLSSFLFIWIATGDISGTITAQALALMGISSATALASSALRSIKRDGATERAARLARQEAELDAAGVLAAPARAQITREIQWALRRAGKGSKRSFWIDILSDVDDGVALHRFQLVAWTLVLGVVFVVTVIQTLAMPQFDQTLTILLGIGSGAYLGFKIPEEYRRAT